MSTCSDCKEVGPPYSSFYCACISIVIIISYISSGQLKTQTWASESAKENDAQKETTNRYHPTLMRKPFKVMTYTRPEWFADITVHNTIFKAGHRYNVARKLLHLKWWEGTDIKWPEDAEFVVYCSNKADSARHRLWNRMVEALHFDVFCGRVYTISRIGDRIDNGFEGYKYDYVLLDSVSLLDAGIETPFGGVGRSVHLPANNPHLLHTFKEVKSFLSNMRLG